ncbi:hypothetical protein ACP70R_014160 [Stipagrostis hirtigluma subsp. patula]
MTPVPKEDLGDSGFLGQYKGHLCYMLPCDPHCGFLGQYEEDLSIWVLEDITTDDWILKHQMGFDITGDAMVHLVLQLMSVLKTCTVCQLCQV